MDIIAELKSAVRDVRNDIAEHLEHERWLRNQDAYWHSNIHAARADELRKWDSRLTRLLAQAMEDAR